MDAEHTQTLTDRIQRSSLLSPDRAEALLAVVPTLTDEQAAELAGVLDSENGFTQELGARVVMDAVTLKDADSLARIDDATRRTEKLSKGGDEQAERSGEQEQADRLFDAA